MASPASTSQSSELVVVTGLSGAGKSTAIAALEDLGFFCVDNLPIPLVENTLSALEEQAIRRVALGIDVRVGAFFAQAVPVLERIGQDARFRVHVLFLDAADPALIRRFVSTRRPHPLNTDVAPSAEREAVALLDGILIERERLAPLRGLASAVIDTTDLTVHDLRRRVLFQFSSLGEGASRLQVRVVSFGFKYGLPVDSDLVLDVRFLKNPYFVASLRDMTGLEEPVKAYVLGSAEGEEYLARTLDWLGYCLPRFEAEGKTFLTIAVGCTGGKHRSVALAEAIASGLQESTGLRLDAIHRDIQRDRAEDSVRSESLSELGRGHPGRGQR